LAFAKNELFWYLLNENIKHAARKEHRVLDATITSLVWHIYHTRVVLMEKELSMYMIHVHHYSHQIIYQGSNFNGYDQRDGPMLKFSDQIVSG
jgi:hypothetical protein